MDTTLEAVVSTAITTKKMKRIRVIRDTDNGPLKKMSELLYKFDWDNYNKGNSMVAPSAHFEFASSKFALECSNSPVYMLIRANFDAIDSLLESGEKWLVRMAIRIAMDTIDLVHWKRRAIRRRNFINPREVIARAERAIENCFVILDGVE